MLTARERKALNTADDCDGVGRGDSGFMGVGIPTLDGLIERGLLERIPHPVTGRPLYRTTPAGQAALRKPDPPKPKRTRPRLKMLQPRLKAVDPRSIKPRR